MYFGLYFTEKHVLLWKISQLFSTGIHNPSVYRLFTTLRGLPSGIPLLPFRAPSFSLAESGGMSIPAPVAKRAP
jgi:hypothetical protein